MKLTRELLKAYKQAVSAAIGNRSAGEIAYDNAVVAEMNRGLNPEAAIVRAGISHPDEALQITPDNRNDLIARFEFLQEHDKLMRMVRNNKH